MEKMNIALIAINKFFFYAQNYPCVEVTFPSIREWREENICPHSSRHLSHILWSILWANGLVQPTTQIPMVIL